MLVTDCALHSASSPGFLRESPGDEVALHSPVGEAGHPSNGKAPPEKSNLFKVGHSIKIFVIDLPYVYSI